MKTKTAVFICVAVAILISAVASTYFIKSSINKQNVSLLSPLPKVLSAIFPVESSSEKNWNPKIESLIDTGVKKPYLSATSALSYDLTTQKFLFNQDIKKKLPIASLTKIMTALVALENEPLDKKITIKKNDLVGENSMGLDIGEILTLEQLLYGLILPSGNDAAEAISEGSRFGRDNFIYLMNKKAEDFGLTDTHFTNPSGLEGDGNQYSSAYDLLVITFHALQNPTFKKIASTYEYHIEESKNHKAFNLYNDTNLLTSYPGVKGVKTGYTDEAGLCLVTYLEYGGHKIIAILLNSQNRRTEMKELLDYSLKTLGITPPPHS